MGPILHGLEVPPELSGGSRNITVNTGKLSVLDGAKVEVSNARVNNAGVLKVNANSVLLDTKGTITAATAFGEGGNINFNVRDFLLLRNNSLITASASGNGYGGNIWIRGGSIAAVPTENSDIRANSVNARGGNVTINASGIFGIQFRPQSTPLSDITATGASSALGGTVQLNIERLDPTSGLIALPTTVVDSSHLIAQGCPADQGSSFVVSGRGGLPPNPEQQLDDDALWSSDRRRLTGTESGELGNIERRRHGTMSTNASNAAIPPIIEATGWQTTPTGTVILLAATPHIGMQNALNRRIVCPGSR